MTILRWGLIGAGDIVRKRVAPALIAAENSKLVAVCRGRAELANAFADEFGIPRAYSSAVELLQDTSIDAVYIASPVNLHCSQTLAAAAAGKHVLCEKPLGLSPGEARGMVEACEFHGVTFGVAYYRRFYPVLRRVREIIEAGEIGRVAVAQMNSFEYFDPPEDHPRRWLLDKKKSGGGPMMDFGCHRLEVLTSLFGAVKGVKSSVTNAIFGREVEDTAIALLQFESGVGGSVTVTHAAFEPKDTLDIYGTRGSIHIPVVNGAEMTVVAAGETRVESHPPHANVHQPLIEDFIDAVLNKKSPTVSGQTGLLVDELEAKIYGN